MTMMEPSQHSGTGFAVTTPPLRKDSCIEDQYRASFNSHDQAGNVSSTSTTSSTRKRPAEQSTANGGTAESRKRATTACSTCRSRKTRCDNVRPKCSYCANKGAKCRYPNEPAAISTETELILEKLSSLETMMKLQGQQQQQQPIYPNINHNSGSSGVPSTAVASPLTGANHHDSSVVIASTPGPSSIHLPSPSSLNVPNYPRTTVNAIFSWPIYRNYYFKHEYAQIAPTLHPFYNCQPHQSTTMGTKRTSLSNSKPRPLYSSKTAVSTELPHLRALIKRFMIEVHTKNPIFDAELLDSYAIEVAEHGLMWDTTSCLILLVCALGLIASPYHPEEDEEDCSTKEDEMNSRAETSFSFTYPPPSSVPAPEEEEDENEHNLEMARAYWAAAEKRLGLSMMEDGIVGVQIQLLAGMYHMYNMQPLPAWKMFNSACVSFQGFICTANENGPLDPREESLKQRLYWSALKCECEIRDEVPLPASGISQLDYPDTFPSPPTIISKEDPSQYHFTASTLTFSPPLSIFTSGLPKPSSLFTSGSPTSGSRRNRHQPLYSQQELHERSWFYYLAEIALRRLLNRIINTWDAPSPPSTSAPTHDLHPSLSLPEMVTIVTEFEDQLHGWYTSLPPALSFPVNAVLLADELLQHIRSRFIRIHEILYRPFIYHCIHHAPASPALRRLAEKGLWYMFLVTMNGSATRHRHQGTFYACRAHSACCLTLLAAAIAGAGAPPEERLELPEGWMRGVDRTIALLGQWEGCLANLKAVRELLVKVKRMAVEMGATGGVGGAGGMGMGMGFAEAERRAAVAEARAAAGVLMEELV
ncbi:hypothetical protein EDC01DRAFT_730818 [Geopyxis carbonaria]|nr:hypothetical protein EDC01DRAFT_730818 [Geopyxis carbonaria]